MMANQTANIETGRADAPGRSRRNPVWTYDETVVLLDLYQRAGQAGPDHPAVVAASRMLRRLGNERGVVAAETYRNPSGVAMKLKAMAQQDPNWVALGRAGLTAVAMDAKVWSRFANDPTGLAAHMATLIDGGYVEETGTRRSSHGPAPSFGTVSGERVDGETVLYLLRLEGPVQALFATRTVRPPLIVAKVGRTREIARRVAELSVGFPPTSGLSWTVLETVTFETALSAHHAERSLLDLADASGWAIGGEFVIAPQAELVTRVRETQNRAKDGS